MDSSSPYKPLEESCKSDVGGSVATILLYPMFRDVQSTIYGSLQKFVQSKWISQQGWGYSINIKCFMLFWLRESNRSTKNHSQTLGNLAGSGLFADKLLFLFLVSYQELQIEGKRLGDFYYIIFFSVYSFNVMLMLSEYFRYSEVWIVVIQ